VNKLQGCGCTGSCPASNSLGLGGSRHDREARFLHGVVTYTTRVRIPSDPLLLLHISMNSVDIIYKLTTVFVKTADSFMLTRLITDDIKKKYKIPVDAKPFPRGGFNSVFINSDDNVVAFVDTPHACGAAYKAVGRNLASVPEVYDLDEIEVLKNRDRDFNDTEKDVPALNWERNKLKICVIVMERLGELDANEEKLFDELYASLWSHDPKYKQIEKNIRNIFAEFASDFDDLIYTMKKENVDHRDFYAHNVGRSKDGRLKLIDWESIRMNDKRYE